MPLNEEQLWQVTKAAALLDPSLRGNFLRALASRLGGVSRPSNRELDGALCAALAQYGVAAGRGVLGEPRRTRAAGSGAHARRAVRSCAEGPAPGQGRPLVVSSGRNA